MADFYVSQALFNPYSRDTKILKLTKEDVKKLRKPPKPLDIKFHAKIEEPLYWLVWAQEWEESERGWGCRPDGFSVHFRKEDIDDFLNEMRKRESEGQPKGYIPDSYSRPCGEPFMVKITDKKLLPKKNENGSWLPHDWKKP
jgi:hypothetical protein